MSDDAMLQKAVIAQLRWEPSIDGAHIGVVANNGVVTLTGHVDNFAAKHAAEATVRLVKGVKAVVEEIEVRLPFAQRDDVVLATAAIDRLGWDVHVPRDTVQVTVEQSHVTLTGEVDWHFQKKAAEQDVCRLHGVLGVSNRITIKPRISAPNLSDDIMHAMHRSWFFDTKTIDVTTDLGRVVLTGKVHTPHDWQVAAATAWGTAGVTDVINEIQIN